VIPREVLRQVNLEPGEKVFFTAREGFVELVPESTVASWLRRGRETARQVGGAPDAE
jgi:bifunctional DNA-binding transcriptional regulator/antitoxin component of YhaV-PrlF toxin-antitoxin module